MRTCAIGSLPWQPKQTRRRRFQSTASILVNIDKSKQSMTVFVDGVQRYHWPVSTGAPGLFDAVGNLYRQLNERDLVQQAVGQRPHAARGLFHQGGPRNSWHQRDKAARKTRIAWMRTTVTTRMPLHFTHLWRRMGSRIRKSCSSGLPQVERARLRDRAWVRLRLPCDTNLVIEQNCTSSPSHAEALFGRRWRRR